MSEARTSTRTKGGRLTQLVVSAPPFLFLLAFFLIPALIMVVASLRYPGEFGGLAPLTATAPGEEAGTITINPNGEPLTVTGGEEIKGLVAGNLIENQSGVKLFSQEVIRKRHQVPALQDAKDKTVRIGEKWNGLKTVSFDMMGTNTYEKIYTLQQIDMKNGQEIAVVDMNSMPSLKGEQAGADMSKIFDKRSVFSGVLQLNLSTGHIEQYIEKLQAEWVIADPTAPQKPEEEPSSLKMGTMELFKLERIN